LRFEFQIPSDEVRRMLVQGSYVVPLQFVALVLLGVYLFIWRYIGIAELPRFAAAACVTCMPLVALRLGLPQQHRQWQVPLSVTLMDTILAFGGVLGIRILRRPAYEWAKKRRRGSAHARGRRLPVLLIGAGRAGVLAAGEIQSRRDSNLEIRGFI